MKQEDTPELRKEISEMAAAIKAITPYPTADQSITRTTAGWTISHNHKNISAAGEAKEAELAGELRGLQFLAATPDPDENTFLRPTDYWIKALPVDPNTNAATYAGDELKFQIGGRHRNVNYREYREALDNPDRNAYWNWLAANQQGMQETITSPDTPPYCELILPPPTQAQLLLAKQVWGVTQTLYVNGYEVPISAAVNVGSGSWVWNKPIAVGASYSQFVDSQKFTARPLLNVRDVGLTSPNSHPVQYRRISVGLSYWVPQP